MDFFDVVEARASVRSFVKCEVPEADMERILDAGRRAPSGYNRQPCEFIVVRSEQILQELGRIQGCIAQASAAIAIVGMDEGVGDAPRSPQASSGTLGGPPQGLRTGHYG